LERDDPEGGVGIRACLGMASGRRCEKIGGAGRRRQGIPMNVLILGGTGATGRHLCEKAAAASHAVTVQVSLIVIAHSAPS
jgi:hypothetical protein